MNEIEWNCNAQGPPPFSRSWEARKASGGESRQPSSAQGEALQSGKLCISRGRRDKGGGVFIFFYYRSGRKEKQKKKKPCSSQEDQRRQRQREKKRERRLDSKI